MNLNLTNEEQLLVNSELRKNGKSMPVAYIFWIFLGTLGGPRFYLRKKGTAIAQLVLTLTGIGFIVSAVWAIVDLFLIPGITQKLNNNVENTITEEVLSKRSAI